MADSNNKNEELNPGQADADEKLSGSVNPNTAADLQDQETSATPGAADGDVSDLESGVGVASSSYANNYTGKNRKISGVKKAKALLGGKGPLFAIGGGIGLAGVILLLLVPAFMLFHLLANLFDTYDPSSTALTQITKMMIVNKLGANEATAGSCSTVKIACRFKTPTNDLLRQLDAKGIKAYSLGADGKPKPMDIYSKSKWPTERVKFLAFGTGSDRVMIDAKDLRSTLQTNAKFRIAFNKTVNKLGARAFTRFSPSFLKVMEKFKFRIYDKLGQKAPEVKQGQNAIADVVRDAVKLKGAVGEAADEASRAAAWAANVTLKVNEALSHIAKASKGSGIVLVMAMECMAHEIPGMVKKVMVAAQQAALVGAAAPVVTSISAVQAGDGNPEVVSQLGEKFTEKTSDGNSALNSAGMKYGLYHDKDTTTDPTYKNVTPAAFGDALTGLDLADQILKNPVSNAYCELLMNPITGAAIAAGINVAVVGTTSLATFGLSFAINAVVGLSITAAINAFGDGVGEALGTAVAPALAQAAQPALDKMNGAGPTFGNVFAAGLGVIAENKGANTFGTAMTTNELSAYSKAIQEQRLADAEVDRATLSPLDASSEYTFLGSMVNQLMPYYSSLSSVSGGLSVLSSLVPISFGSVMKMSTANAADEASIYENACPNPEDIKAANGETRAANIYCQGVYAINVGDSWKPDSTMEAMLNIPDAINDETGEAVVNDNALAETFEDVTDLSGIIPGQDLDISYADWVEVCTNTENANQCTGDDNTQVTYGLYTAAKDVNVMLDTSAEDLNGDGEDSEEASSGNFDNYFATTETTDSQIVQNSFSIVSFVRASLRTHGQSLFASTPAPLTNVLARFTLWR
jgi:hypothetical protein